MAEPNLSQELLRILVCPETKQPVKLLDQQTVARLNETIGRRALTNRGGQIVEATIDGALVRADGQVAYPVRSDIPVMLIEESFELPKAGS